MPTNETNKSKMYSQGEKTGRFFVNKYDEASDANRTDKFPQKKVYHENTRNRRKRLAIYCIGIGISNESKIITIEHNFDIL